jgi:hypothetical protein
MQRSTIIITEVEDTEENLVEENDTYVVAPAVKVQIDECIAKLLKTSS